jgi:SPP1 family predicted phage head-tail adaptor
MIAAGRRRHAVTLQTVTQAADNDGSFTDTPTTLACVRASIEPATARQLERVAAGTVIAQASHVVTIPYLCGVTTQTRVLFGTRILHVLGVSNADERGRELVLVCSETVA